MREEFCYPRPEYPRPDRQRGSAEGYDWLNLNGPWQFRFDTGTEGINGEWFAVNGVDWREQILVPFCWESLAAWGEADSAGSDNYYATRVFRNPLEVNRANHRSATRYEVGWYRRWVEIPSHPPWQGKDVILTIGAADFFTDCWCNGIHLGRHEGGYTPFEFNLTEALGNGSRRALIVLRVEDPMDNAEQPVGKQWRWYTTTSGIWQTVFVEPRDKTYLQSFRIFPDIDAGTARFVVQCCNASRDSEVRVRINLPESRTQTGVIKLRNGGGDLTLKLKTLRLWDPNAPFLYPVRFELIRAGSTVDQVRSYFGMRKIDFEIPENSGVPTALRLNGQARYLRGALYQSYHADGVYTAATEETLKEDIRQAKKFGFNFLRIHIKIDDPILLYWADHLGILLMADFPNFGEGGDTALGRRRFETMLREGIERDFNHPSIFAWCLFNETWGFGGQNSFLDQLLAPVPASWTDVETDADPLAAPSVGAGPPAEDPKNTLAKISAPQVWVQQMWELAKQLDPTRLVEDMSVCHWDHLEYYQHCETDINSWHFYLADYEKAKAHIQDIVSSTFVGSSFNYVPGFLHKGQPLINSEYGGVGALDGDRDVSWSFKFLTNELRRHPQIAAYIYTELHDVEWEYNGLLNYDRTPKVLGYDPRIVNESNALPINAPPVIKIAPRAVAQLEVASSHFSTQHIENVSLCWRLSGIDDRGRLYQDVSSGRTPIAFPHRQVAPAHTIELPMPETAMLCMLMAEAQSPDGQIIARNFVHYYVSSRYPPAREEIAGGLVLRGYPAEWTQAEWSGGMGDQAQAREEDLCYGVGHGFFEWTLPLGDANPAKARRIKVLCEASSHRMDTPQTDGNIFPTAFEISLNGVKLFQAVLRNHPHDARGVLSYWRGKVGAYGYLIHAVAEKRLLSEVLKNIRNNELQLKCSVPAEALTQGGLTLYGAECGRFPVCPTIILEW